jgi:hypothetical protein
VCVVRLIRRAIGVAIRTRRLGGGGLRRTFLTAPAAVDPDLFEATFAATF